MNSSSNRKQRKLWESFQSGYKAKPVPEKNSPQLIRQGDPFSRNKWVDRTAPTEDYMDWMNDIALRVEMGHPLPHSPPSARDILRSMCKTFSESEEFIELPQLGKGKNSLISKQVDFNSDKEDNTYQDSTPTLVIRSTPQGRMVRWEEPGLHH